MDKMNARSLLQFSGSYAVVTGAGSVAGIGYAMCELLHELGAKVFALDREFQSGTSVPWMQLKCDVSDHDACRAVFETIGEHAPAIDVLVNSAGIIAATRVPDLTAADFQKMLQVNTVGVFNVTHAALELMKRRGAAIVNIASIAAQRGGGIQGGAHYAASKGAVASFTKACAREFAASGIRANYINPGVIETGMTQGKFSPDQVNGMLAQIPLGRLGSPRDVAYTAAFLSSPAAAYITGTSVDVNGGYHIY